MEVIAIPFFYDAMAYDTDSGDEDSLGYPDDIISINDDDIIIVADDFSDDDEEDYYTPYEDDDITLV